MSLVLLGYMGSGKSSVGKLLSKATEASFMDLDTYIEQNEGKTISEIFASQGEIYFRKVEAIYLKELLGKEKRLVLATGGGTPCYGQVMDELLSMEQVQTIYLQCSVDTLTKRLWSEKDHRPLIAHLTSKALLSDFIRKHLFERAFYYNRSKIKVDCSTLSEREIVEKILFHLL